MQSLCVTHRAYSPGLTPVLPWPWYEDWRPETRIDARVGKSGEAGPS